MDTFSFETVVMYAYRILGTGFLLRLVANIAKYGWRLPALAWPLVLTVSMFSLGAVPEHKLRQSGEWTRRYFGVLAVALVWSSIILDPSVAPWP